MLITLVKMSQDFFCSFYYVWDQKDGSYRVGGNEATLDSVHCFK